MTKLYTYQGKSYTIKELAELSRISSDVIYNRITTLGWDLRTALTTPVNIKRYFFQGKYYTIEELSEISGITSRNLRSRIDDYHWTVQRAMETPVRQRQSKRLYNYNGKKYNVMQLSKILDIEVSNLRHMLNSGLTVKEITSNHTRRTRQKVYEYKGERLKLSELSFKYNINVRTLRHRLNRGWTLEKAIEIPVSYKNQNVGGK